MTVPSAATTKSVLRPWISFSSGSPRPQAHAVCEHAEIAGPVADEREILRGEMRDDDLARFSGAAACRRRRRLDDDVLGRDVHPTGGARVRDESGIAAAVAVGDPAAECRRDRLPLIFVESLGCHERHADTEFVEPEPRSDACRAMRASADG